MVTLRALESQHPQWRNVMPSYTLNIDIDSSDLNPIYNAGELITITKQTSSGSAVAWVAFSPFENNTVTWTDSYALYASNTSIQAGAVISQMSNVAATPGSLYPFANGAFGASSPDPTLPPNTYEISNGMPQFPQLTFGLAQGVQVNGTGFPNNPINAQPVPASQTATFTPYDTISVFLMSQVQTSQVLTTVVSKSIQLTFGGSTTSQTISYDAQTGGWDLVSPADQQVRLLRPALHAAVDAFAKSFKGRAR